MRTSLLAGMALVAVAVGSAQANPRDASSKIMGHYNFDSKSGSVTAPRPMMAPQAVESRRMYSHEPSAPAAAKPAPTVRQPATAARPCPPQSARRFSYEPSMAAPTGMRPYRQHASPYTRYLHADSKIRGHFE
jgi:hypothetical protein